MYRIFGIAKESRSRMMKQSNHVMKVDVPNSVQNQLQHLHLAKCTSISTALASIPQVRPRKFNMLRIDKTKTRKCQKTILLVVWSKEMSLDLLLLAEAKLAHLLLNQLYTIDHNLLASIQGPLSTSNKALPSLTWDLHTSCDCQAEK